MYGMDLCFFFFPVSSDISCCHLAAAHLCWIPWPVHLLSPFACLLLFYAWSACFYDISVLATICAW